MRSAKSFELASMRLERETRLELATPTLATQHLQFGAIRIGGASTWRSKTTTLGPPRRGWVALDGEPGSMEGGLGWVEEPDHPRCRPRVCSRFGSSGRARRGNRCARSSWDIFDEDVGLGGRAEQQAAAWTLNEPKGGLS